MMTNRSFDNWLEHVFDHDVKHGNEWYWEDDCDEWDEPAEITVDYITKLFTSPKSYLQKYTEEQVDQGINYILSSSLSGMMCELVCKDVPGEKRFQSVQSFYTFFKEYYAVKYSDDLASINWDGANPLNHSCYMWWDICPVFPCSYSADDEFKEKICCEAICVMEKTLYLDSLTCQESALHGLGHWSAYYPKKVQSIIRKFLASSLGKPKKLIEYAEKAKVGEVL